MGLIYEHLPPLVPMPWLDVLAGLSFAACVLGALSSRDPPRED